MDQTHVSFVSCIGRQILYHWATREAFLSLALWSFFIVIFHVGRFFCYQLLETTFDKPWFRRILLKFTITDCSLEPGMLFMAAYRSLWRKNSSFCFTRTLCKPLLLSISEFSYNKDSFRNSDHIFTQIIRIIQEKEEFTLIIQMSTYEN